MPESTVVRTKRDGVIVYSSSGASETYTVAYEPGDFSYDVPGVAVLLFLDRGVINGGGGSTPSIRQGDEQPMTFAHTAYLRDLGDTSGTGGYTTLPDLLHPYDSGVVDSDWTSTLASAAGDVFTVTTALTMDGTAFGEADKTVTFPFCAVRGSVSEGDPSTVSVSGTSYAVRPTLS